MDSYYTHKAILFEKIAIDDYKILKPVNIVNCKPIEEGYANVLELEYEVENLGILPDMFTETFDDLSPVIGFVTDINELNNTENEYKKINSIIFSYLYLQEIDYINDVVHIIRINTEKNELIRLNNSISLANIANFSKLINDKQTDYKDNSIVNKENNEDIAKNKKNNDKNNVEIIDNEINLKEIYYYLKKRVIGQDESIKQILSTIDRNYHISNYRNKTNIFLIGPSGSGKTEIFRSIAEKINVPITIEDSEQYSAVGYVGSSIEDMLIKLYQNANEDLEKAQRGILVIDEIDKKISNDKDNVSGNRILTSLLSLMEGTNFRIDLNGNSSFPNYINFDTNYLNVVLLGACSDLVATHKRLGINSNLFEKNNYNDIDEEKLEEYGFPREFLRRVSIYKLNELSIDNLVEIMTKSSNSVLKEYKEYAKKKKIDLEITDKGIEEIAKKAYKKGIGASGIKATLNEILNDAFFEVEFNKKIYSGIKVDENSIKQVPPYQLIKRKNTSSKKTNNTK